MAKILFKSNLAPSVYEFLVDAPLIAHKCQPGQFVMIRTDEDSERIPLTIADFDREKGTITLIVQAVGNTTKHLCETFEEGDDILDVVGPLGHPSDMGKVGTVGCVGGGIGVAPVYPIARAYHELGNKVISIVGARSKDLIIWRDKMQAISDELIITTDDGSEGHKGFVTDPLREMLEKGESLPNVILMYGEENYYRSKAAACIKKYVFGSAADEDMEISVFDRDTDLKRLNAAVNTYPIFGGSSLVIISDDKIFAAEKKQKENLEAILANIPEFCHVFISVSKIDKRGRLYKMLAAEGAACECKSLKPYQL